MKKTALLFIAALVIMANIDFIWPFTSERKDGDVFEQGLNTAEMQIYQDPDLGFMVRYPSFDAFSVVCGGFVRLFVVIKKFALQYNNHLTKYQYILTSDTIFL